MPELSDQQFEELQQLLAKNKTPDPGQQQHQPQSQPFTINLGGNSYQVNDQDQAQRLIDQYEAQRGQEVEAERVKGVAAQQRAEQLEQQLSPRVQAQRQDGFDKEEYARLFLDDPRKANRYALQHDPEQIQFYQGLISQVQTLKQEQAASQFLLQHKEDYVPTQANFKAIEGVISQFNLPWDINGMNLAFTVAKGLGQLEEPEAPAQRGGARQQQAQLEDEESFVAAPRVARRRSSQAQGQAEDVLGQFESLSPDKMKAYLESLASR